MGGVAGYIYTFAAGTRQFSIRGIELEAGLDPNDPTVFVVGLTFDGVGAVSMVQTPLVTTVVPEPATWALCVAGLALAGLRRRRRLAA